VADDPVLDEVDDEADEGGAAGEDVDVTEPLVPEAVVVVVVGGAAAGVTGGGATAAGGAAGRRGFVD